jgi:high affinity Mn2+ porin
MKFITNISVILLFLSSIMKAQNTQMHFQLTAITQGHNDWNAPYRGKNSLDSSEDSKTSLTSTLFLGFRLGKNTEFYINPEIAGGEGLSRATGVAGFPNGETFRVGATKPVAYLARAYVAQWIPLSKNVVDSSFVQLDDKANQLSRILPKKYIRLVGGKFCLADFFDGNTFSHDPRSQFMNWSLMSNGAWDYAANVRGYTVGAMAEYVETGKQAVRICAALLPTEANGADLNYNIGEALSWQIEYERSWHLGLGDGKIRALAFLNSANMGNYDEAKTKQIDISETRFFGRKKVGLGLNIEQNLSENVGIFARGSWNDGKNETWAFTEIDNSFSFGGVLKGNISSQPTEWGVAWVRNGISNEHASYLKNGGLGFIIGDGKLNYAGENIGETYVKIALFNQKLHLSANYQLVINPAYNGDRKGPIHFFGLRTHIEF